MRARVRFRGFLVAGIAVAVALAFFVSPLASSEPDGLDKVAIETRFDVAETPHALDGTPTAHYDVRGLDNDRLSTGLAGVIGVVVTFALAAGLFAIVRRARPTADDGQTS